jgi:predicted DNA-binding transcriptional regulator AlpA
MAELLNQRQAAERLRLSTRTLERFRLTGGGPRYCKLGARVLYLQSELDAWVAEHLRHSTSENVGQMMVGR